METINILIADDHEIIHNGIKEVLRSQKDLLITGHSYNGREAVDAAIKQKPDLIFMDISMPLMNGIEATCEIKSLLPQIKIIALTQHHEKEYILQFLKAGGNGYLLKNSRKEDFLEAIRTVMSGKHYLSADISELLIETSIKLTAAEGKESEVHLTRREIEIIRKIADDKSNPQIADELNISIRTVETHRRNLMQKLKVNSVIALLRYAAMQNIIKFPRT